jgi:hypothetical protein
MLCKIAKFYPAYKISDLADVPKRTLDVMWECITIMEAQDQLKLFNALDWPNMKKQDRSKLHRELYRQAYPSALKKKQSVNLSDLQRILNNGR